MCDNTAPSTQSIADYLAQLLKDRKQLAAFPNVFIHVERLLDEEIARVRASLFQINGVKKEPLILPEPEGQPTTLTEKVYVPVKEHPDFNFVGRILGPRGMTAKQLEQETGCKIMVRGKGSMRDKKKEDQNRGKPNWEHLSDELHVLLTVEDTENRAHIKLERAVEEVKKLLVPQAEGEDELKKRQLMELAIINGTYRDSSTKAAAATACDEEWRRVAAAAADAQRLLSPGIPGLATPMRTPTTPLGAPLILSPRMSVPTTAASILNGSAPPEFHSEAFDLNGRCVIGGNRWMLCSLLSPGDPHGLIYTPYADYTNYAALAASPLLTEYATADHSGAAAAAVAAKQRRHLGQIRDHPYQRAGALS
ncbi:protein held out wings isoform X1 [Coccinella septempunctata]|uniref:protein held out wings isoform X1 n=1 Tax=Coccinella septempunctata TaxID=41139 RepID=UPI001D07DF11|nr:protein held out wings isoform X1 [Coccinella septempunctata]